MKPKVTVCIPTFNYAEYISQAIDSVLMQDYQDYELLIVDDRSTDTTANIVQQYLDRGELNFRFVVNETNRGMVNNWNYCLELARGEYIKFLFADDFLTVPNALSLMVQALDQHPDVSLTSSSRQIVSADSRLQKELSHFPGDCIVNGKKVIQQCLCRMKNLIGEPSAVMFRKKDAGRGFDTDYKQLVDLEMWFHLLEKGNYAFFHESLCSFRTHDKQQTAVNRARPETILETGKLHEQYLSKPYIKISELVRQYLIYDYKYQIWKSGMNSPELLYDSLFTRLLFHLNLAFYKTAKPLVKLFLK